jgi:hypothetical protein
MQLPWFQFDVLRIDHWIMCSGGMRPIGWSPQQNKLLQVCPEGPEECHAA